MYCCVAEHCVGCRGLNVPVLPLLHEKCASIIYRMFTAFNNPEFNVSFRVMKEDTLFTSEIWLGTIYLSDTVAFQGGWPEVTHHARLRAKLSLPESLGQGAQMRPNHNPTLINVGLHTTKSSCKQKDTDRRIQTEGYKEKDI